MSEDTYKDESLSKLMSEAEEYIKEFSVTDNMVNAYLQLEDFTIELSEGMANANCEAIHKAAVKGEIPKYDYGKLFANLPGEKNG